MAEAQCNSLAVYDESNIILKRFSERQQQVVVGNFTINLRQDWQRNGVSGVLWDSAIILSEYLLRSKEEMQKKKRILELGAGLGLPSIIAAKALNANEIIATDQKASLPLLKRNIQSNLNKEYNISVMELDWTQLEDWDNGEFDLIIGADLVYDKEMFEPLKMVLLHFLGSRTSCLLASKIRYPKDEHFYRQLTKYLNVEEVYYDAAVDVKVFRITKT